MLRSLYLPTKFASLLLLVAVMSSCSSTNVTSLDSPVMVESANPNIQYSGRYELTDGDRVTVGYSGARLRMRFKGESVAVRLLDDTGENYAKVWIDGEPMETFRLDSEDGLYPLADGLADGEHTVEVMRITECSFGLTHFQGFELGANGKVLPWVDETSRKIEFIGDSITCGYGVEAEDPTRSFEAATENFSESYSGLTARELDADYLVVSRSGIGMVRNYNGPYGGSEDSLPSLYSNTFYMDSRFAWDFDRFVPDVVCINLGTNDFSTTGVDVEKYKDAYVSFASRVLENYPEAKLVVLQGPMNNSEELGAALDSVISRLKQIAVGRVHFLELSPQGSVGFGADYHPNRAQSKINAEELTAFLADLMDWH